MANSVDPDQIAPSGAVCSRSTLFASILNLSVMLGNYLQQTTSADDEFFLGALRVNSHTNPFLCSIRVSIKMSDVKVKIRPRKKICLVQVTLLTLNFYPLP